MGATLTVIYWRDIPAQVLAKNGRLSSKIVLHPRFQVAIDRAAMNAGKREMNAYIAEWRRVGRPCGDDLEAEANAEAKRLETLFDREALKRLVASGGLDDATAAGAADPSASTTDSLATPTEETDQ